MVEGTALEMRHTGNRIVGSNPTLSAILALTIAASLPASAKTTQTQTTKIEVTDFTTGLEQPWGAAFLPDGRMLVSEKAGRLRLVDKDGKVSAPLKGVPPVDDDGQGGLLDVTIDPDFTRNGLIYFSFAEPDSEGQAGTAVARAKLSGDALQELRVIWRQEPKARGGNHFGSRLVFARDGTLFVTMGERYDHRDGAQDLSNHFGKVVRITTDGAAAKDNPFLGKENVKPDIWSYGHRNVQGAALNPETGELWTHEHGPRGGDEINIARAGRNYGWPVITYGREYWGPRIGEGAAKAGMEQPLHQWTPSIAPSGMLFYTGSAFPQWKGNLFIGSLKFMYLDRVTLDGEKVAAEEKLLEDVEERIRDVEQGPDGCLYVLTDNADGRILKIAPAK